MPEVKNPTFNVEIVENGFIVRKERPEGKKSLVSEEMLVFRTKTEVMNDFQAFLGSQGSAEE